VLRVIDPLAETVPESQVPEAKLGALAEVVPLTLMLKVVPEGYCPAYANEFQVYAAAEPASK